MSIGFLFLMTILIVLFGMAVVRGSDSMPMALKRGLEQFAMLVPRMLCALVAAGFIAKLIPSEFISTFIGQGAGLAAIPIAAAVGLIIPAGPVIAFSIAAVFAHSGASVPALVTFVTSWSIYAAHRILIYELPLIGPSFLRLRAASTLVVPFLAGLIATLTGVAMSLGPIGIKP